MKILAFILLFALNAFAYDEAIAPNINIYQGEDFVQIWQLKGCSAYNKYNICTSMTPVDLTGCSFKAYAKKKLSDVTSFINFSTSVFNNLSGSIKLSLSHNQTINFSTTQNAYFDMYVKYPNGSIQYLLKSNVITNPTATH